MAGRSTELESSAVRLGIGERLLAGAFRGCWLVMRAAARCCGASGGDEASGAPYAPVDFQALALLGYAPLGEIAAARREVCAWAENAGTGARPVTQTYTPPGIPQQSGESSLHVCIF